MTKNIKLAMHTADLSDEKFLALQDLFPEAVTETITTDESGERVVTRAIDADVLQQLINKKVVSGKEERYQFTWPDKKKAMLLANAPINKTLRPCREESVDFDNTENLYIEGDNLDVLKLLRETYLGKIKMIYIDPPYNTGSDFVYEDDFAEDTQEFLRRDNQIDEHGNRLVTNTESNGRFHTDWLNMMYPRLMLARDLLTEDGVIFISIDDNEVENLKKICNEVFGNDSFLAQQIIVTGASQNGDGVIIQKNTEYCIVYAKSINYVKINKVDKAEESLRNLSDAPTPLHTRPEMGYTIYYNPVNNHVIPIHDYDNNKIYLNEEHQVYKDNIDLVSNGYIIIRPGKKNNMLHRWRWGLETFTNRMSELTFKCNDGKYSVYFTQSGYNPPKNLLNYSAGTNELKKIFNESKYFDYPKSSLFMKYLISIGSNKDSVILDFFSGSSSTAHAVMQLNAEDNGNRKFIMVQLPESTDEKSEAFKAGYKNICEIGKERIRRAGIKIKEEVGLTAQNLDIGFRVLKLDESNMNNVFYSPDEYKETNFKFEDLIENVKPDRTHEDILFQVMLELGVPLSAKINVDGNIITVDDNYLVACFDKVDSETVTRIAKMQPYYAVFRDSSFINDSSLINVDQIFNTYSPTTKRRVI